MPFSVFETFSQFLMQDILPLASSPLFWTIVLALSTLIVLHYMYFPCTTLCGLERTVEKANWLFKTYQMDWALHYQTLPIDSLECIMEFMEFEEELLRIKKGMNEISLGDYGSSWKRCVSFSRVRAVSILYKKTRTLQRKIEHSKAIGLQRHNSWSLQLVLLKRRQSNDYDEQLLTR